MTTTYYLVYPDEAAARDKPWGLFRRIVEDGRVVASDAYNPRWGWRQTDYWLRLKMRGEGDRFLVEVDEETAMEVQAEFTRVHEQT